VKAGFGVNVRDKNTGATSLISVIFYGYYESVVEYLLFHGADKSR
jgi:hypothetical protein